MSDKETPDAERDWANVCAEVIMDALLNAGIVNGEAYLSADSKPVAAIIRRHEAARVSADGPACHLCDKGFPTREGVHYGTQSLGMIPSQLCWNASPEESASWIVESNELITERGRADFRQAIACAIEHAERRAAPPSLPARGGVGEIEAARYRQLIIDSHQPHGKCYWGLGFLFSPDTMKEDCVACAAKRQMKSIANGMGAAVIRASRQVVDKGEVARLLSALTDEDRLEMFNQYCKSCGSEDTGCQCWNDE